MKRLLDPQTETYSEHGIRVGRNISKAVTKIVRGYLKRGYSAVELEHLIVREVSFTITMEKLRRMARKAGS